METLNLYLEVLINLVMLGLLLWDVRTQLGTR